MKLEFLILFLLLNSTDDLEHCKLFFDALSFEKYLLSVNFLGLAAISKNILWIFINLDNLLFVSLSVLFFDLYFNLLKIWIRNLYFI